MLGTPYYMAPEQVTGQNITEQVDVYAFGVLLFEVLSGVKPISGDTVERIFYSILNEPLNLEPLHKAGVPEAVCDLVARCTAKAPAARPQGFTPVCAESGARHFRPRCSHAKNRAGPRGPRRLPSPPNWKLIAAAAALFWLAAPVLYFALAPRPPSLGTGACRGKDPSLLASENSHCPLATWCSFRKARSVW